MAFKNDSIFWVEVEKITANPYQPRREFDEARLEELAESIRMYGVLQPLTVTRREIQRENGAFHTEYELIAGERRLRASKKAGVGLVPVIIREGEQDEQEKLELAIIENLQREDLNAVDRAMAFKQLAETFKLSHTQVAKKVGRSREYVSNSVRLLALPEHMLQALRKGDIAEGHARTLLMMNEQPEEQDTVFREVMLKKLSVREVERIARSVATDKVRRKDKYYDPEITALEKKFTETLGTRVQIQKTDYGGKLTIDYFSPEDLAYMLKLMNEEHRDGAQSGRRPFSPPASEKDLYAQASKEAADTSVERSEGAPLSALIAQLQQAEEQFSPAAPQPYVDAGEQDDTLQQDTPSTHSLDDFFDTPRSAENRDDTFEKFAPDNDHFDHGPEKAAEPRVTLTDAPVSPVRHDETVRHSRPTTNYVMPQSSGPRIVCVNRECTTAVYVADMMQPPVSEQSQTNSDIPQENDQSPAPEKDRASRVEADADLDLYSIRNFNL